MKDTRPLWERALARRGTLQRRRLHARLFLEGSRDLKGTEFLDLVRALVGLKPLYAANYVNEQVHSGGFGYVRLESLRRAALPGCDRCGGSGYYDGEALDMHCPCTKLPQRAKTARVHTSVNRSFARIRRA